MKNRAELDADLDTLATQMPAMLEATSDVDQMDHFAALAQLIEAHTSADDWEHVWSRLQCILRSNEMVPGDEEPYDTQ